MAAAALSHSLGCRCGTPVCERTQCPLHGLCGVQGRLGMQGRHAAARAAARPSKRRWRASRSSRCAGRQLVPGAARGGFKVGDLLRLAADRCSLEYHSSSVHTEASCCAAACSPRRARALQASSRGEEAAEISVQHVADRGWQAHSSCTVRAGT